MASKRVRLTKTLAILLLAALATSGCDRGLAPGNLGKPAPPFVVSDSTNTVDLSKLRGHVVLVNLWATWCLPCLDELPSLITLQRQMPDLVIVAISLDQDEAAYRRFLLHNHVNFVTVRDPSATVNHLYGTAQIPETYVIDKRGILQRKFVNSQNWTDPRIIAYLRKLDAAP